MKKRKIKSIFASVLVAALLICGSSVAAMAGENSYENPLTGAEITVPSTLTDAENSAESTYTGAEISGVSTEADVDTNDQAPADINTTLQEENAASELTEPSVFQLIYDELMSHADDIFALLSFAGTLILALIYKKGLFPMVRGALGSMRDVLEKSKTESESAQSRAISGLEKIADGLKRNEECSEALLCSVAALEGRLAALESGSGERRTRDLLLAAEADMLYEIFMSSELPQQKKEAATAKVRRIREELGIYEEKSI